MGKRLIYGIGVNDADYVTQPIARGKPVKCVVYSTWQEMLRRCYDQKYLVKRPTYVGCLVDKEWHSFMNFRAWMLTQDFEGKQLDKDLLYPGNKIYSKDTCVFISPALNVFLTARRYKQRDLPVGVAVSGGKFKAMCSNPFTRTNEYLGTFSTPEAAHLAWKKYKHELALEYAKLETDRRIIRALQERYL